MKNYMDDLLLQLEVANFRAFEFKEKQLEDFEYLLHHITINDDDEEELHHCYLLDHMANMFEQNHLVVRDGKAYLGGKSIKSGNFHVVVGLEPKQQVVWVDKDAIENKIKPKKMVEGMTLKQKAREW